MPAESHAPKPPESRAWEIPRATNALRMTPAGSDARETASLARAGGFLLGGASDDAEHLFLAHDHKILAVQLDFGSGILAEQDAVPLLDSKRMNLAFFIDLTFADGDDFALLRLILGGVGD